MQGEDGERRKKENERWCLQKAAHADYGRFCVAFHYSKRQRDIIEPNFARVEQVGFLAIRIRFSNERGFGPLVQGL